MTIHPVIHAVCDYYKLYPHDLTGPRRPRYIVRPRHIAMLLLREQGLSYPRIGKILERDHSTVMDGVLRAQDLARTNRDYRSDIKRLRIKLRGAA